MEGALRKLARIVSDGPAADATRRPSLTQWLERHWQNAKQNPAPYAVGAAATVGIGSLLLDVHGHYKIAPNYHWRQRTLPQLIETAFALKTITELRGDPRGCLAEINRLCNDIKHLRQKRVLFAIDRLMRPAVVYRMGRILERLWDEAPPDLDLQDGYFHYFQGLRVILEPAHHEIDELVIGGMANQGTLHTYEYETGLQYASDAESFLMPEMVLISAHAPPHDVIKRIVDFASQGMGLRYEERVMLRSRPEITMECIRRADPNYQNASSRLFSVANEVEAAGRRYL